MSGAFTDTRITKATVSGGAEDDRVPYIPRYTATLSADYEIPLASDMTFFVGGDVNFVGARYTDLPGNLSNYHRLGAYQLANAHIGVEKDGWRLSAILKNVTNDDTVIDQNQTIPGLTVTNYMPNRPRTVLFQVEKKF